MDLTALEGPELPRKESAAALLVHSCAVGTPGQLVVNGHAQVLTLLNQLNIPLQDTASE